MHLSTIIKHATAWILCITLAWSFRVPLDHIPHDRVALCRPIASEWLRLACYRLPGILFIRCVSSVMFVWNLPWWLNWWLDGLAGAVVSMRILRAVWRGVRDESLDRLVGGNPKGSDGSPEAKRRLWARHNEVLTLQNKGRSTAASGTGVSNIQGDSKQKQVNKKASVDAAV